MKQLYYLINHEYRLISKPVLVLLLGNFLLSQLLVLRLTWGYDGGENPQYLRYEQILDRSGIPLLYLLTILAIILSAAWSLHSQFQPTKSLYTLFQLPVRTTIILAAKWISLLIGLFEAVIGQLLAIVTAYACWYQFAAGDNAMKNGLFLAWIRSDFLNLLIPGRWVVILTVLLAYLLLSATALGMVLEMRKSSARRLSAAITVVILTALIWILAKVGLTLNQNLSGINWLSRLLPQIMLLLLIIYRSVRHLSRRDAE